MKCPRCSYATVVPKWKFSRSQPARTAGEIFVAVLFHHFRQPPDESALVGLPQFLAVRIYHPGKRLARRPPRLAVDRHHRNDAGRGLTGRQITPAPGASLERPPGANFFRRNALRWSFRASRKFLVLRAPDRAKGHRPLESIMFCAPVE